MSTPEEINAAFADSTTYFEPIAGRPEEYDVHRLRQQAMNLLQGVLFGGKSDSLSGMIYDITDFSIQYGHNFNRLEYDLLAYNLYINDYAKNIVRVCAERAWTKKLANQAPIESSGRGLNNFFFAVVNKKWTKEL